MATYDEARSKRAIATNQYLGSNAGKAPAWLAGNIVGIGVGRRFARDEAKRGEVCLRFYVGNKIDGREMLGGLAVSADYEGVPTDVVEVGRFVPLNQVRDAVPGRERPARPGSSIGPETARHDAFAQGGSLGALVRDKGAAYILSCNHVLAANGLAGSEIVQPSRMVSAPAGNQIATLTRWEPLESGTADCAIAKVYQGNLVERGRVRDTVQATAGMRVTRDATGAGWGEVIDCDARVRVHYPHLGTFEFDDQIVIRDNDPAKPFSAPGDSGSVVLDEMDHAVGLLFAGTELPVEINGQRVRVAVATPIQTVLDRMGVQFA